MKSSFLSSRKWYIFNIYLQVADLCLDLLAAKEFQEILILWMAIPLLTRETVSHLWKIYILWTEILNLPRTENSPVLPSTTPILSTNIRFLQGSYLGKEALNQAWMQCLQVYHHQNHFFQKLMQILVSFRVPFPLSLDSAVMTWCQCIDHLHQTRSK